MNEIVNNVLLAGDIFMAEIHLRQPGLHIVPVDHLQKTKKEYKHLKKQDVHDMLVERTR